MMVGTVAYMSPEQVRAKELDARSDLFSFGAVLYEMATGALPFHGESSGVIFKAILDSAPPAPIRFNRNIPPDLERIINKALEKDRNLRYQHAADMRTDLQRLKRDTESGRAGVTDEPRAETSSASQSKADVPAPPSVTDRVRTDQVRTDHVGTAALGRSGRAKLGGYIAAAVVLVLVIAAGLYWRSRPTPRLTDKDTVVLADFANSTGDAIFDDTLKTALNVSLRQSPFLNVLSDGDIARTLKQMTRTADTKLTAPVAREICQRADSKAYIAGAIGSLGSKYVLELKAVNCQSGDLLAEEQVTAASKEKVLDALGDAASKLRGELGESLATVQKFDVPLQQATTSSLDALKELSLGKEADSSKGTAASLPHYQRAIQLDPNFAMGYRAAGGDYVSLGELGRASEYITKAFQLREHASEREKLAIVADYTSSVTGELDKAAQAYQEQIETYHDPGLYASLGAVYYSQGQYEKAAELTGQAVRLFPGNVGYYENLANDQLALQRFDKARKTVENLQARKMDDFALHNSLYALAFVGSDATAMADQQHWFADKPAYENFGLALASDTEGYTGHMRKARELTRRAVDSAIRADN